MLAAMTTPLPPGAQQLITRVYQMAKGLQACGLDTADLRAAMLISMEEAFILLDCARGDSWQLFVDAPNVPGSPERSSRYDLTVEPRPGVAWARLFGVTLIIDADVAQPPVT